MFNVVVTDDRYGSYKEEKEVLSEIGARLTVYDFKADDHVFPYLEDVDALLVNLFPMTSRIIGALKKCKVISRYGVGFDNVDVDAAWEQGIWVARVPDYCTEDVSDHAVALLLSAIRSIAFKDRRIRQGGWNLQQDQPCHRIEGKVLGIIGYGRSGQAVRKKMSGFSLSRVLVHDPSESAAKLRADSVEQASLREVLACSDYVTIHVPLMPATEHMIGEKELDLMKESAILVNTSRGPVLDEEALYLALKNETIAGAALDVFTEEPLPVFSPLKKLDNVVLSDHSGWYSIESISDLKTKAAQNVLAVLKGGEPVSPVLPDSNLKRGAFYELQKKRLF